VILELRRSMQSISLLFYCDLNVSEISQGRVQIQPRDLKDGAVGYCVYVSSASFVSIYRKVQCAPHVTRSNDNKLNELPSRLADCN